MGVWDTQYADAADTVAPSDTLIFYSDGLVEARRVAGHGAAEAVRSGRSRPRRGVRALRSRAGDHAALAVRDDVTAMVVQIREEALHAVVGDSALAAAAAQS